MVARLRVLLWLDKPQPLMGILPCGISSLWHPGGQREVYLPSLVVQAPGWQLPRDACLGIKAFLMCWDHALRDHQAMEKVTKQWRRSPSDGLMANTSLVVGKERDGLTAEGNYFRFCAAWMSCRPPAPLSAVAWGVISCWRCPAFPIYLEMFAPAPSELLEFVRWDLGDSFTWGEEHWGSHGGLSVYI